jgi:hypothetical protein
MFDRPDLARELNRRLLTFDKIGVTFRHKDYRRDSAERYRAMTLTTGEFIRRFMLHVR